MTAYNYTQVQALRVRRLCEQPRTSVKKDTSIYSLRRIVDEMRQSRNLLDRDNISAAYGIPSTNDTSAVTVGNTYAMLDKILDGDGKLSEELLKELDERLLIDKNAQLSEIVRFVDKNIAHSCPPPHIINN